MPPPPKRCKQKNTLSDTALSTDKMKQIQQSVQSVSYISMPPPPKRCKQKNTLSDTALSTDKMIQIQQSVQSVSYISIL